MGYVAMNLRLSDSEADALRRKAAEENRSMQEVAKRGAREGGSGGAATVSVQVGMLVQQRKRGIEVLGLEAVHGKAPGDDLPRPLGCPALAPAASHVDDLLQDLDAELACELAPCQARHERAARLAVDVLGAERVEEDVGVDQRPAHSGSQRPRS